jgi:hypothetical protein
MDGSMPIGTKAIRFGVDSLFNWAIVWPHTSAPEYFLTAI